MESGDESFSYPANGPVARELTRLRNTVTTLEQQVETAEIVIERRDAKIKRQAECITRLETSRASLREALASQEKA